MLSSRSLLALLGQRRAFSSTGQASLNTEIVDASSPSSRLFVFHGLFGAGQNWRSVARTLNQNVPDLSVVLVDLPDHGSSPHSPIPLTYPGLADSCAELVRDARFSPARRIGLGHSMGGKVTMWMALAQPTLFDRLVVVDVAPVDYPLTGDLQHSSLVRLAHVMLNTKLEGRTRAEITNDLALQIPDVGLRQFLLTNLVRKHADSDEFKWRCNLQNLIASFETIKSFPSLDLINPYEGQTLFIRGAESNYIQDSDRPLLNKLFPNSQVVSIPGAGHWPHFGPSAKDFCTQLESFLLQAD